MTIVFSFQNLYLNDFLFGICLVKYVSFIQYYFYIFFLLLNLQLCFCKVKDSSCFLVEMYDVDGIEHNLDHIMNSQDSFNICSLLNYLVIFEEMHKFLNIHVYLFFLKENKKTSFRKLNFFALQVHFICINFQIFLIEQ